jgi:glutamine synthetase
MEKVDVSGIVEDLRARGIDVIRVSYSDMIGTDRGRDVLLDELATAMGHGLAFCRAIYHTSPRGDVVPVQGGLESGLPDIKARPDLSTLTDLPWEPGAAWVLADVDAQDGEPAGEGPRHVARHVSAKLAELGLRAVIGPELEFYVLEPDPTCDRGWKRYADEPGNVYVVGRKGDPRGILLTMLRYLRDAKLQVTAANHEFSAGQFEINLNHSELVDAADRAFRMKSGVQEIARHEGMLATFMAKPFNDEGGSGFHLHVSLVDGDGANVFGDGAHDLSDVGRSAIAGVLAHAPALAAILNPTINSYKRFGPDTLAPWLIDWGMDNRSAMVRIPPERGQSTRMEVRLGDATANPYLAMAAVSAAVYLGVRDKLAPPAPLEGYGYDPASAPMLPQSLPEALDALEADAELREVLGEYFVTSFLTYKRNEVERFSRHITDWEFLEYAYHL